MRQLMDLTAPVALASGIGVVGVGLIGRAWSNVFARAGWDVSLFDADAGTLERAPGLHAHVDLVRVGLLGELGLRRAAITGLRADDVPGVLELPRMCAEIAVGDAEEVTQIGEGQ